MLIWASGIIHFNEFEGRFKELWNCFIRLWFFFKDNDNVTMKIGIDGSYALAGNKGNEEMTCKVIEMLATDYPHYCMLVYTPKLERKTRLSLIDELHNAEYRLPAPSGFTGRMWQLFGITNCLLPDKVDVYHGINGELPLNIDAGHVPAVVTVSDSDIFDTPAGIFELGKRFDQYVKKKAWNKATLIIAGSQEVKTILTEHFCIEESKILVIPASAQTAETLVAAYTQAILFFQPR